MNSTTNIPYSSTTPHGQSLPITPVVMLFVFGALGNILAVVILIHSSKRHQWKTFYRLVAALAVSDFIGILGPLPISLAAYSNNKVWIGGQPVCDLMSFFFIFAGLASASLAGAMSLDRFIAVRMPHFYCRHVSKRRVNILIAGIFSFAFIVACLPLVGLNKNVRQFPGTWCFFDFVATEAKDRFFSFLYASLGTISILLMIVLNTIVTVDLGKTCIRARKRKRTTERNDEISRSLNTNSVYNMIFLVVLMAVFTICWVPLMARIFINQIHLMQKEPEADLLVMRLAITNQIMDPWIYIIFRKDFIVLLLKLIKRHVKRGPSTTPDEVDRSDRATSSTSVRNSSSLPVNGIYFTK